MTSLFSDVEKLKQLKLDLTKWPLRITTWKCWKKEINPPLDFLQNTDKLLNTMKTLFVSILTLTLLSFLVPSFAAGQHKPSHG